MMKKRAAPRKAAPKAQKKSKTPAKKMASRSSKAPVRRFASGGPAGPNGPNSGPSGTHDTKTSSGRSQNSSPKSPSGPSGPNSSASGTRSTGSSSVSSDRGSKGNYNSGTSGSRYGGASTQAPGMGRNEGRVGPSSPMGGQGTSFSTPEKAKKANDAYTDRYGFQNKVNSRLPSSMEDIQDIRGRMGPFKGPLEGGLMSDNVYGPFNPNNPYTIRQQQDFIRSLADKRDAFNRDVVSNRSAAALGGMRVTRDNKTYRPSGDMRTPQEVREQAARFNDEMGRADAEADREYFGYNQPSFGTGFRASLGRSLASGLTPDVKVGRGRIKDGGLVKKNKKTFKDK